MAKVKLTKYWARRWRTQVRELRKYYQGKPSTCDKYGTCNLCELAREQRESIRECACYYCLWEIFAKSTCWIPKSVVLELLKSGMDVNITRARLSRLPHWRKLSIKRLTRWEKRLNEIIEG